MTCIFPSSLLEIPLFIQGVIDERDPHIRRQNLDLIDTHLPNFMGASDWIEPTLARLVAAPDLEVARHIQPHLKFFDPQILRSITEAIFYRLLLLSPSNTILLERDKRVQKDDIPRLHGLLETLNITGHFLRTPSHQTTPFVTAIDFPDETRAWLHDITLHAPLGQIHKHPKAWLRTYRTSVDAFPENSHRHAALLALMLRIIVRNAPPSLQESTLRQDLPKVDTIGLLALLDLSALMRDHQASAHTILEWHDTLGDLSEQEKNDVIGVVAYPDSPAPRRYLSQNAQRAINALL